MHSPTSDRPRCANCGMEIPWRPAIHRGTTYCCGGCAQGGPCYCSYDLTGRERSRARRPEPMLAVSHAPVADYARDVG